MFVLSEHFVSRSNPDVQLDKKLEKELGAAAHSSQVSFYDDAGVSIFLLPNGLVDLRIARFVEMWHTSFSLLVTGGVVYSTVANSRRDGQLGSDQLTEPIGMARFKPNWWATSYQSFDGHGY